LSLIRNQRPSKLPTPGETQKAKKARAEETAFSKTPESWNISEFPEIKNLEQRLQELERIGLKNPYFHVHDGTARNRSVIDGVEMLNFSSYNYLGFSGHPEVIAAAKEAIDLYGTSVSASRLVSGERPVHRKLEQDLPGISGSRPLLFL